MIDFQTPTRESGLTNVKQHKLKCLKEVAKFLPGITYTCYIQKMTSGDKRYMVYTSSGIETKYHVFESKEEIEDHFEELDERGVAFAART